MQALGTVGLDIAKSVFRVPGVDVKGKVVFCRQVGRARVVPFFKKVTPRLIGMQACVGAHQLSRKLKALGHGRTILLTDINTPHWDDDQ